MGAGISGLTFAAAMRRFSPEAKVELYERDQSATSRSLGYSLGLKGDAGLAVLKTLGLYDRLAKEAVTIKNFVFCNQRGEPLLELPMSPFQGQGANMAMLDGLKLAQHFADLAANPANAEAKAKALEADIVARGRTAVLDSRNTAKQFHVTNRWQRGL